MTGLEQFAWRKGSYLVGSELEAVEGVDALVATSSGLLSLELVAVVGVGTGFNGVGFHLVQAFFGGATSIRCRRSCANRGAYKTQYFFHHPFFVHKLCVGRRRATHVLVFEVSTLTNTTCRNPPTALRLLKYLQWQRVIIRWTNNCCTARTYPDKRRPTQSLRLVSSEILHYTSMDFYSRWWIVPVPNRRQPLTVSWWA